MPSAKSNRVAERRRKRNAPLRTRAKTLVARARGLVESSESDGAEKAVADAMVALDNAAQKGALHKRNASRRKSRLMKRLNASKAAAPE